MTQAAAHKPRKIFDNRYEILSIVGRGHCSVVYHARHVSVPSAEVALKVLLDRKDSRSNAERLRHEALALVQARHSYVIRLDDFHSVKDLCYLSLEYAAEGDLRKFADSRGGPLEPALALRFMGQMAEALHHIHSVGIIHRDIKPDNILIVNEFEARLGDFGVAILPGIPSSFEELQRGVGTMDYMAPEVLEGVRYDPLSDLYALGVSFFELLTGIHPFSNVPLLEQVEIRKSVDFGPLRELTGEVPAQFVAAIEKCMAFDAQDRYQSAGELLALLAPARAKRVNPVKENGVPVKPTAAKQSRAKFQAEDGDTPEISSIALLSRSASPSASSSASSSALPGMASVSPLPRRKIRVRKNRSRIQYDRLAGVESGIVGSAALSAETSDSAIAINELESTNEGGVILSEAAPVNVAITEERQVGDLSQGVASGIEQETSGEVVSASGDEPLTEPDYSAGILSESVDSERIGQEQSDNTAQPSDGQPSDGASDMTVRDSSTDLLNDPDLFGPFSIDDAGNQAQGMLAQGMLAEDLLSGDSPSYLDSDYSENSDAKYSEDAQYKLSQPEQKLDSVDSEFEPQKLIAQTGINPENLPAKVSSIRKDLTVVPSSSGSAAVKAPLQGKLTSSQQALASRVTRSKTMRIDREMVEKIRALSSEKESAASKSQPGVRKAHVPISPGLKHRFSIYLVLVLFVVFLACSYLWMNLRSVDNGVGDRLATTSGAENAEARAQKAALMADAVFPFLPAGIYSGTAAGIVPGNDVSLTVLSLPKRNMLVFIAGVEGWEPVRISLDGISREEVLTSGIKPLRIAANGFLLELSGQVVDGVVIGSFVNLVNGDEGAWRASL